MSLGYKHRRCLNMMEEKHFLLFYRMQHISLILCYHCKAYLPFQINKSTAGITVACKTDQTWSCSVCSTQLSVQLNPLRINCAQNFEKPKRQS